MDEDVTLDKTINCYCIDKKDDATLHEKAEELGRIFGINTTYFMLMEKKKAYEMNSRLEGNPLDYHEIQCDLEHSLRNEIRLIFFTEDARESLEALREYFESRNPEYKFHELSLEPLEVLASKYQQ